MGERGERAERGTDERHPEEGKRSAEIKVTDHIGMTSVTEGKKEGYDETE